MKNTYSQLPIRRRVTVAMTAVALSAALVSPAHAYTRGTTPDITEATCKEYNGPRYMTVRWDKNAGKPTHVGILGDASSNIVYRRLTHRELLNGLAQFSVPSAAEYRVEIWSREGRDTVYVSSCPSAV